MPESRVCSGEVERCFGSVVDLRGDLRLLSPAGSGGQDAHFEVPEATGLELIEALRKRLPGYAVPQFVREMAGESSKSPIIRCDEASGQNRDIPRRRRTWCPRLAFLHA